LITSKRTFSRIGCIPSSSSSSSSSSFKAFKPSSVGIKQHTQDRVLLSLLLLIRTYYNPNERQTVYNICENTDRFTRVGASVSDGAGQLDTGNVFVAHGTFSTRATTRWRVFGTFLVPRWPVAADKYLRYKYVIPEWRSRVRV